jgi:hypothetical protein
MTHPTDTPIPSNSRELKPTDAKPVTNGGCWSYSVPNAPMFDLDPADPWPVPEARPVAPISMLERVAQWIERKLS